MTVDSTAPSRVVLMADGVGHVEALLTSVQTVVQTAGSLAPSEVASRVASTVEHMVALKAHLSVAEMADLSAV
jgi:hypothetical protein